MIVHSFECSRQTEQLHHEKDSDVPIYYRNDEKPVVTLDPLLEVSAFALFRRMRDGKHPQLVDVRTDPSGMTLEGSTRIPGPDWEPDTDEEILLFDDDGTKAVELAKALQAKGFESVRALFGGLELYEFSLDPQVVGQETFLVPFEA